MSVVQEKQNEWHPVPPPKEKLIGNKIKRTIGVEFRQILFTLFLFIYLFSFFLQDKRGDSGENF